MLRPSFCGSSFRLSGILEPAAREKHNQRPDQQHSRDQHQRPQPFNGESHGQLNYPKARREPLRQALAHLAPEQARGCSGDLFDSRREGDELADVLFDVARGGRSRVRRLLQGMAASEPKSMRTWPSCS
jgi:hypothetical protein